MPCSGNRASSTAVAGYLAARLGTSFAFAGLAAGLTNGSFACLLTDLFPTRIRFTGVALVFNISFTIFSGTAPLVATTLIRDMGTVRAPALLMIGCSLLALTGSIWVERYGGHVLAENMGGAPDARRVRGPG